MKSDDNSTSVQRTDSQRSQTNGPRVSFNKDVHIKKIAPRRLSDPLQDTRSFHVRREHPSELSESALKQEAAKVLSQVGKLGKNQHVTLKRSASDSKRKREVEKNKNFGSLPSRRKAAVGRSLSDASAKKSKRPSIFNFFTKRNEYNLDEEEKKKEASNIDNNKTKKPIVRSKSDVGQRHDFRKSPRRKSSESEDVGVVGSKKNPQLSPIIEDQSRDDYFENNQTETSETDKKPIIKTYSNNNTNNQSVSLSEMKNISRPYDAVHSSQLPPEKLPLTKGVKVPSMVKRLSMEKLSPPPTSDAFTYLPSPQRLPSQERKIIYAELDHEYKPFYDHQHKGATNLNSVLKPEPFIDTVDSKTPPKHNSGKIFLYDNDDYDDDFNTNKQTPAERFASKYKTSSNYYLDNKFSSLDNDDEVIQPKLRDLPPERPPLIWSLGRREQGDGKEYHENEFNDLSNRREELYSRIKSRINREPVKIIEQQNNLKIGNEVLDSTPRNSFKDGGNKEPAPKYINVHTTNKITRSREDSPYRMPRTEERSPRQHYENVTFNHKPREGFIKTAYLSPIREPSREVSIEYSGNHNETQKVKDKQQSKRSKKQNLTESRSLNISSDKLLHVTKKFLELERRHTDDTNRVVYTYRERSIDDGSRYDPLIDKYDYKSLPRRQERHFESERNKDEKRFNSLGRVKKLFKGATLKRDKENQEKLPKKTKNAFNDDQEVITRNSMLNNQHDPEVQEIANRRRLSTPRSSPVAQRNGTTYTHSEVQPLKTSWFKSLDRLTRRKSKSNDNVLDDEPVRERSVSPFQRLTRSQSKPPKQSLRFFGDTDIESNADSVSKIRTIPKSRKSVSNLTKSGKLYSQSAYNLSSGSVDKQKKQKRYSDRSSSLYDLNKPETTSLRKTRKDRTSRSRELHNIIEDVSTSENENNNSFSPNRKYYSESKLKAGREYSTSSEHVIPIKVEKGEQRQKSVSKYDESDHFNSLKSNYKNDRNRERLSLSPMRTSYDNEHGVKGHDSKKPPLGPPKPARDFQRRREIERIHDSSGTEGESSQRSVVYLHATTVGDIPPQYYMKPTRSSSRSVTRSRDDLTTTDGGKGIEPMTKTVSRSISMLAPWRPKFISEGYEIDYSKSSPNRYVTPDRPNGNSFSTLPKVNKQNDRERSKRSHKSADRVDYGYSDETETGRRQDGYKQKFSRDYEQNSPIRHYNYRTKVLI